MINQIAQQTKYLRVIISMDKAIIKVDCYVSSGPHSSCVVCNPEAPEEIQLLACLLRELQLKLTSKQDEKDESLLDRSQDAFIKLLNFIFSDRILQTGGSYDCGHRIVATVFLNQLCCSEKELNLHSQALFEGVVKRNYQIDVLVSQQKQICKLITLKTQMSPEDVKIVNEEPINLPNEQKAEEVNEQEVVPPIKDQIFEPSEPQVLPEDPNLSRMAYIDQQNLQYYQYCLNWSPYSPYFQGNL